MRFKKIGCGLLAALLALPLAMPAQAHAAGRFSDTAGHWAEGYIDTAVHENVINGYPDGRFRPDKAVTRAEFASMVNKALGNNATESISFTDVSQRDWYYTDVSKALAAAYTAGYDDNTFRPDNPISRQEAAVMISRIVPAYGKEGNLREYPDRDRISDWAYESLAKANGKGYIGAYNDGRIHPLDQLTRAQTAKIICEILDHETIVRTNTVVDEDRDKLAGKIYSNNVTVDEDLGDGSATIDNCVILGVLSIKGGGTDSITISNSRIASATVNKEDDSVHVIAKGETAIVNLSASKASTLQASSLHGGLFGPGFSNITVNDSAEISLKGNFPRINISGSRARIGLDSGTIENLIVGGKYSDVTAGSGTTVKTATVNAESYFHGSGTISQMNVNADGVTYETKPKHWTIANNADTPSREGGTSDDISFSPKNGATNVSPDSDLTVTFDSAVEMHDGDSIKASDVEDFIELRKGSSSGSLVDFSGNISSSKKVITIDPDSALSEYTKYYLIIEANAVCDDHGDEIGKQTVYFTTGHDHNSVTTSYSPANGAASVSQNPAVTITFSEDIVRYSNGASISANDSYLKDCIVFRKGNASGERVSFSASIDSAKKVITIYPGSSLAANQTYYLGIISNTLKSKDHNETVPSTSVTWTTVGYTAPALSNFSVAPGDTTLTPCMTPNVAGRIYAVVIPYGSAAPSAVQIAAGQNSSGRQTLGYAKNENAAANTPVTLPAMGGLGSGFSYDVWATLYSTATGTYSKPVKLSATTSIPRVSLTDLTVRPVLPDATGENQISFSPAVNAYSVSLNSSVSVVEIKTNADAAAVVTMTGNGLGTVYGAGSLAVAADVASNPVVTVEVACQGKISSSYTIKLTQVSDTSLKALKIDGSFQSVGDNNFIFALPTNGAISISLEMATSDKYAIVTTPAGADISVETVLNIPGYANFSLALPGGSYPAAIEFSVISGNAVSPPYTITFTRP